MPRLDKVPKESNQDFNLGGGKLSKVVSLPQAALRARSNNTIKRLTQCRIFTGTYRYGGTNNEKKKKQN